MKTTLITMVLIFSVCAGAGAYDLIWDFNQPYVVDSYTMGLWHFDEVTGSDTAYDETINANDAVIDPGAVFDVYGPLDPNLTWGTGKFDTSTESWLVSAADQNVGTLVAPQDIPGSGNSTLFISGDFTVEFWMNAEATSPGTWMHSILTKGTGSVFGIVFDQNNIFFSWSSGGQQNYRDPTFIPLNEWHHVAITLDNTTLDTESIITFYIDGDFSSQVTGNRVQDDPANGYDLTILGPIGGHPYNCFKGKLDELRISDIDRMNPPQPPTGFERLEADLFTVGLWHFDELPGGDTAYDETHFENDAVIDTNATQYDYGPLDPDLTWAPAADGNGLTTWSVSVGDHNVGTLVVPQDVPGTGGNDSLYIRGDFSIEFWMNAEATSHGSWEHYILCKGTGSVYNIRFDDNVISVGWYGVGVGWAHPGIDDTTYIPLNEWHHVSMRVQNRIGPSNDQAFVEFYIDGAFSSSDTVAAFQDDPSQGYDLTILGPQGGHPFNTFKGQLDELRISNVFRTNVPETLPFWMQPFEPDPYTRGLWHFNQEPGDTIIPDDSGNGNDATTETGINNPPMYTELDPNDNLWNPSMQSFGNCITPYDSSADTYDYGNIGSLRVDQNETNNTLGIGPVTDLTVEFWMYTENVQGLGYDVFVSKYTGGDYMVGMDYGYIIFTYWVNGGFLNTWSSDTISLTPQWNHIAVVVDRTTYEDTDTLYFFINGEPAGENIIDAGGDLTAREAWLLGGASSHFASCFSGKVDELRISAAIRPYGDLEGPGPLHINWIDKVGDDIMFEFNSWMSTLYSIKMADSPAGPWETLDGVLADLTYGKYRTLYTHANALVGTPRKFYRVETFSAESMGYASLTSVSPTVDALLGDWSENEKIADRSNFFELSDGRFQPYVQCDVYGGYNESDAAYYFALEVAEQSSSDVFELMFIDTSETTSQIRFDKAGQFVWYVFDGASVQPRKDSGGDTYTLADFTAEGGEFAQFAFGGTWRVEIKVPYSFIGATYDLPGGAQRSMIFNWETGAATMMGTTNPNKTFWPIGGGPAYVEPNVGVSRP